LSYDRLVLYNPAAFAALAAAPAGAGNPRLLVGGQQLAFYCHNNLQRTVLAMPGRDVDFVRGRISEAQVLSSRPSYINGILIQSRGTLVRGGCNKCRSRGFTPFPTCVRLVGHFGGACGNCKWRDHAARCVVHDEDDGDSSEAGSDGLLLEDPEEPVEPGPGAMVLYRPGSGVADDPIQLD
jgi:hypothetical protein